MALSWRCNAAIDIGGGVVDQWSITGHICMLMLAMENSDAQNLA
jgi:hypothetical protein